MEKTNKELINELQDFFLKQDPSIIARILAGMMIDMNRIMSMDTLGKNEKDCLLVRMEANRNELVRFAKEGPRNEKPLKYFNIESNDER